MGDMGDIWNEQKEYGKKKRGDNRENAPTILFEHGIKFEAKNCGAHLIVEGKNCIIDFWPGTGKWILRKDTRNAGRGIFNLIKHHCQPNKHEPAKPEQAQKVIDTLNEECPF